MLMTMVIMMMIMMMKTQNDHNSDNFEAITSQFCMVIDLNETYRMKMTIMMMTMMMMMRRMMMKMKLIITWPILKLQTPDFAW